MSGWLQPLGLQFSVMVLLEHASWNWISNNEGMSLDSSAGFQWRSLSVWGDTLGETLPIGPRNQTSMLKLI